MNTAFTRPAYEFAFTDPWRGFCRRCLSAGSDALDFREQGYRFPHVRLASTFTRSLPPLVVDLLDVAVAVYLADRLALRRLPGVKHGGQAHPRRDLHVRLPVSDPAFWSAGEVGTVLGDTLHFLTGDAWEFSFEPIVRTEIPRADQQEYLFDLPPDRPPRVMLFSGGLDSFAGAVHQLEDAEHFHVLVSGSTHHRMAERQRAQTARLLAGRDHVAQHLVVAHGLVDKPDNLRGESSQRSRGFLHVSLGAATALLLEVQELSVYENGLGALNLPFDASQIGLETSRAVHPGFLRLMERLLAHVGGTPFAIRTPFLFRTKAETLRHPRMRHFGAGIAETFSCDRFPNYHEHCPQCGQCPSCVLRRLSLEAAGLADLDPSLGYSHDVKDPFTPLRPAAAFVLDKFDAQAHRLRHLLSAERPWAALSRAYPELREVQVAVCRDGDLAPGEVEFSLRRLLGEHADEWRAFSGARTLTRHFQAAA